MLIAELYITFDHICLKRSNELCNPKCSYYAYVTISMESSMEASRSRMFGLRKLFEAVLSASTGGSRAKPARSWASLPVPFDNGGSVRRCTAVATLLQA